MIERAVPILPGDDLGVAKEFYVDRLGFTVEWEDTTDGKEGIMGLRRGGMELTIDCPMTGHGRGLRVVTGEQRRRLLRRMARPGGDQETTAERGMGGAHVRLL